jgi:hypothetical protein
MIRQMILLVGLLFSWSFSGSAEVLIVADEFPAMEVVAHRLKRDAKTESRITDQARMPSTLREFSAVVVYIHKELAPAAERAFIDYAEAGGRLVLLHHSISSGKRQNKDWFQFLGVELPPGPVEQGGYKWTEGVTVQWVSLTTNHFVMTNEMSYSETLSQVHHDGSRTVHPAFTLRETEVYLNHRLIGPRTLLMGLQYRDEKSGKTWVQDTAGWAKAAGNGLVFYFMPGHTLHDFESEVYGRIVVNAITAPPGKLRVAPKP